jgi:electron transfer flavoprotein alpha subunit
LENLPKLIEQGLQKSRIEKENTTGEQLEKVYFAGNIQSVAEKIAKQAIALQTTGKTAEMLAEELKANGVKTVLWEDSEELKILASQTAVLTGAGLCADCISFRAENGKLIMTRPALGGDVTADILCESEMAFATVRTARSDCAELIFSVGKGAMDYIDEIKTLAQQYNAELCCSRAVADSGKLAYEKQVGLTGRTVCPKVYVAFGISGAVQHTCAIAGANTIIAVNNDKDARIFDYADFGIVTEVKNVKL